MWNKEKYSRFSGCPIILKRPNLQTLKKAKQWTRLHLKKSNHSPNIIADIPKAISKRLTNVWCNENVFDRNVDIYQTALKNNGFDGTITYNDQSKHAKHAIIEVNPARKRKRAII